MLLLLNHAWRYTNNMEIEMFVDGCISYFGKFDFGYPALIQKLEFPNQSQSGQWVHPTKHIIESQEKIGVNWQPLSNIHVLVIWVSKSYVTKAHEWTD